MKEILLSAEEVSKSFKINNQLTTVLDKVNVDIYKGDFTVIMGSSGAGKSTMLYALSGIDKISSGKVFYKGSEISGYNEKQMAALRAKEFGFVFQQSNLISNLTLFENVAIAGYLNKTRSAKEVNKYANNLFNMMKIDKVKDQLPFQASGGEAQRVAIARAIIHEPELIFADEPTGALNRKSSEEALDLLTELNEAEQSIVMVTHDLYAAVRGTRLLYVDDGKLVDEITLPKFKKDDIKNREVMVNSWLASLSW